MTQIEKAKWFLEHPAELGKALGYKDFTAMHERWIREMVAGTEDMTLQAHRGSYKTTCLQEAIALMMIHYRDQNIIFLRKTDTDVTEVIKGVYRILTSDIMKQIYRCITGQELVVLRATQSEITTSCYNAPKGSAQLLGMGISGSLTGKHADKVITDDIVNLKDRVSKAEREHTKAVYQELQNIRNPGGRIINTGTPWHREDAFTIMPEPERWDYHRTKMLSETKIEELRRSMAPSLFAANYELRHIAAENALFTKAPVFTDNKLLIRDGIAHVDAAYGGEDYTAFTCGCRRGDVIYMYGKLWHAHVDTVIEKIIADAQDLMCGPIHVERNGDKGFLKKEFSRRGVISHGYDERENKVIKISSYLRKWWPNIIWLEGTDPDYISQILDYTEDAEHDDAPDSAACVCRVLDKRGF